MQQPRETTWIIKNHTTEAECRIISGETEVYGLTKIVSKPLHPFPFPFYTIIIRRKESVFVVNHIYGYLDASEMVII